MIECEPDLVRVRIQHREPAGGIDERLPDRIHRFFGTVEGAD